MMTARLNRSSILTRWVQPLGWTLLLLALSSSAVIHTAGVAEGITRRVSIASDGTPANAWSYSPAISANGRFVAFSSQATNLIPQDSNIADDIFVHDRATGELTRVSVASDGTPGNCLSMQPALSADGMLVAFTSLASNLVPDDSNYVGDIFVHDRQTGQTQRVSVASDGTEGNLASLLPALSADGRFVAFVSHAGNLVPGDSNGVEDIFVHDRQTGQTQRVSVASDGSQSNDHSALPALSANGRFVTFVSRASNLVPQDSNTVNDIFVHDRQTGQTQRVSVASDGSQGDEWSGAPAIAANGRFVTFTSAASNLVSGDSNLVEDIFTHDLQTGQTERVSVASDGRQGDGWSSVSAISAEGRFIAFTSNATSLLSLDENLAQDIFVHDRERGETWRVSVASDGTPSNSWSSNPAISADGRSVVFMSAATTLALEGDQQAAIFVHEHYAYDLYLPLLRLP